MGQRVEKFERVQNSNFSHDLIINLDGRVCELRRPALSE